MKASQLMTALLLAVIFLWIAIAVAAATYDPTTGRKRKMKDRLLLLLAYLPFP